MSPRRTVRLALAAMRSGPDVDANLEQALARVEEAAARGADLVCLPEYCLDPQIERGTDLTDAIARLRAASARHGIWTVFGADAREGGRRYNSLYLVSPQGAVAARYDKIHLWRTEAEHFAAGRTAPVVDIGPCRLGLICCWDIAFPALTADLARRGAELVVCPASLCDYEVDQDALRALPLARAFENLIYFALVDAVGPDTLSDTRICHPRRVMARLADSDGVLVADLDLDALSGLRDYYRGPVEVGG